jgi:hypothetical protein
VSAARWRPARSATKRPPVHGGRIPASRRAGRAGVGSTPSTSVSRASPIDRRRTPCPNVPTVPPASSR